MSVARQGTRRRTVSLCVLTLLLACKGRESQEAPPAPAGTPAPATAPANYVGSGVCASCHAGQAELWRGSDHDLAMQEATGKTVLGDFRGKRVSAQGVTSTFTRRGDGYFVTTDGPDGTLAEFRIAYVFGVRPLQQYLIDFPGGRYQALGLAWDARPAADGGQRWFHLYPRERVRHGDELHWTGPQQTWNHMCAECHSTGLVRNYDPGPDRYATTWSEINVACEACHGPGSNHVAWVGRTGAGGASAEGAAADGDDRGTGFAVRLPRIDQGAWAFDDGRPTARRIAPLPSDAEIDACGRCHARRSWVWEEMVPGRPLADTHRVAPLDEGLYFDDGQIRDEVYEYGSFLQSRMQRAGVVCTDCHDPHSAQTRAQGNDLCSRCHRPEHFDAPAHHHHREGSEGARCVACHMPERTYMVVDPRRDHSLRVPRPDLSAALGTPDACGVCHGDRGARWAADIVARWFPTGRSGQLHFGQALRAARDGRPRSDAMLLEVLADLGEADIVRATALAALPHRVGASAASETNADRTTLAALDAASRDRSHFVRRTLAEWTDPVAPNLKVRLCGTLLDDPIRTVRIAAAASLAGMPASLLGPDRATALDRAVAEYKRSLAWSADRAETHLNLGNLERQLGRQREAESAYRRAISLDPTFIPAPVNLADLLGAEGRDADGEEALRGALGRNPDSPDLEHALGLALIRARRAPEALRHLKRASALRPADARYAFVYAVAQHDLGDPTGALRTLEAAAERHTGDLEIASALSSYYAERGDQANADRWAKRVEELRR